MQQEYNYLLVAPVRCEFYPALRPDRYGQPTPRFIINDQDGAVTELAAFRLLDEDIRRSTR